MYYKKIRILTFSDQIAHTEPLFKQPGILTLEKLYAQMALSLAKSRNLQVGNRPIGIHRTRLALSDTYVNFLHRKERTTRTLAYRLTHLHALIPQSIWLIDNADHSWFKTNLKKFLIYDCQLIAVF